MDKELALRQQIEREYHNNKYRNGAPSADSGEINTAYRFYQGLIEDFSIGRILDFGCGDGWVSVDLGKKGHEVYGIDISIELINKARQWAQGLGFSHRLHFQEMPGENLQFQDEYFDAVVGSAILHHTDFELALDNIYRVLKPGGKGVFIEPMNQNILLKVWRRLTPWRRSPAENALTEAEINLIRKKFPASRLRFFIFTSMLTNGLMTIFPRVRLLTWINTLLEHFDNALIRCFPELGTGCAVVVIELIKPQGRKQSREGMERS